MKIAVVSTVLSLAVFFTNTAAYFALDPFPNVLYVGERYSVSWVASANYSYNIWLVLENPGNPYTWTNGTALGSALRFPTLRPIYTWTVPTGLNTTRFYRLWIDAFPTRAEAANLSNRTDYFAISTSRPSSTTGTINSATASPTSARSSSSASSSSTSAPSSGNPSSSHSSLSGGAIAGIVIGCLLALALAVGAYVLLKWRKKKSAFAKREAEARANRLEPVMQAHSPSYEMHGRAPQASKEISV